MHVPGPRNGCYSRVALLEILGVYATELPLGRLATHGRRAR